MAADDYSMERWPDERLLREANRGNTDAFVSFCVRTLPSLRRYVRFQCYEYDVPTDLADDFCHDAIIKSLDHINSCKENADRPLPKVSVAWLNQIAFNSMRDWRRRNIRVKVLDDFELESKPSSNELIEEYEEVVKFFQWLGDNERDMLELVLVEQCSITEAGERIGLTKANSYKTYERGLKTLRDFLVEHGEHVPSWINR